MFRVDEIMSREAFTKLDHGDQCHVNAVVRDVMTGNADMETLICVVSVVTRSHELAEELAEAVDFDLWG